MIVAKVFQLDHPGVRVRKSRIYIGGPYGRCTNIMVSGIRDSWWSRMIGQRVTTLGVHRARGLKVLDDNQGREASHALVFIDPWSDFLFSIDPVVTLAPAIEVLWEDREVKLLLAPVDSEFSVSISGVWSPSIGGMSHTSGPPILCRRVLFYRVGQGGVVYHDRVI